MWKIRHPEGPGEINTLHVPVGRPVKLRMVSEDVIHSFYIPAFRIKADVLPGRFSTLWFEATRPGVYHLFCAEYCGTAHSKMVGQVVALDPVAYADWLSGGESGEPMAAAGERLYRQLGCDTCHDVATGPRCPSLQNLFGRPVRLRDGRTVTADETYLRESIVDPGARVVAGFEPIMPTYRGQLNEEGLLKLTEYIKSLSAAAEGTP
jgi:cytochrome c oxidase subunit 2